MIPKDARIYSERIFLEMITFICCISGDGNFKFSSSSALYWTSYQHKTPFPTIILNNGGWKAMRSRINDVHSQSLALRITDEELGVALEKRQSRLD